MAIQADLFRRIAKRRSLDAGTAVPARLATLKWGEFRIGKRKCEICSALRAQLAGQLGQKL